MTKGRQKKLSTKIILCCVIFATVLSAVIGWLGYRTYSKNVLERYKVYVDSLIQISAHKIDAEDLRTSIASLEKSEKFDVMQSDLNNVKENAEVEFIYLVYFPDPKNSRQMNYVLNAYTQKEFLEEGNTLNSLGDPCGEGDFDDTMIGLFYDCLYGDIYDPNTRYYTNTSDYGYLMTAYLPLYDLNGDSVCVLAIDISMNEILDNMRSYIITVALGSLGLLIVFLLIFITIMNRSVVSPIKRIAESANNFVQQSYVTKEPTKLLFKKVDVKTKDEIAMLSDSLNHMTSEITDYMVNLAGMTAEKERISAEMDVANQIQYNMFPNVFPAFPNRSDFNIHALRTNAGGDGNFYDFFLVDQNHLCIVAGRSSGKGIPAMLFAVLAAANIRSFARLGYRPYRIVLETNNQLSQNNTEGLSVSAFVGIIDLKTGEMDYINAGQPTTLMKRAGTGFDEIKEVKSFVLANMENVNFYPNQIQFVQGDAMMLYTAGVAETKNGRGDEFSEAYIGIHLNEITKKEYELSRILEEMNHGLDEFKNGSQDDTGGIMLIFRFFG